MAMGINQAVLERFENLPALLRALVPREGRALKRVRLAEHDYAAAISAPQAGQLAIVQDDTSQLLVWVAAQITDGTRLLYETHDGRVYPKDQIFRLNVAISLIDEFVGSDPFELPEVDYSRSGQKVLFTAVHDSKIDLQVGMTARIIAEEDGLTIVELPDGRVIDIYPELVSVQEVAK
jgi:hypothetical protein